MKKFISILLAAVMILSVSAAAFAADGSESTGSFGAYKHVFIIGIDGLGDTFGDVDSPNFDRIFENGAYNLNAHTELKSVSAQNWGSILTGVDYKTHGFTNESAGETERGSDSDNNSVFYYIRQAMPEAQLVSFNNWNAINHGIIENDINVEKINCDSDDLVVEAIQNYFAAGNTPALTFVQLDSVDHAGHAYGGQTDEYYAAAANADIYLGQIYDAINAAGLLDDGLFILVADHGEMTGGGHGGVTFEESSTTVAVAGKTVANTSLPTYTKNRDVAAIVLYALGIEEPSHMTAVVPEGLFTDVTDYSVGANADYSKNLLMHKLYDTVFTPFSKFISFFVNTYAKIAELVS